MLNNKTTLADAGFADSLTGGAGADWFFVSKSGQDIPDTANEDNTTKI
jgi:hypothetical protein